jgi:RNA recognition motif-containing protein
MNAFCFVEFGHADEAYDAVKALDGREKLGKRLRVSAFPWVCPLPSAYAL